LKTTLADFKKWHWGEEKLMVKKNFFEGNFGLKLPDFARKSFKNIGL
jgi:hypothetical protein